MRPHIAIIGLGVRDFERAKRFYSDGLGWPILQEQGEWVCFSLGDGSSALTLYPWDQLAAEAGVPVEGSGFGGITFSYNVRAEQRVDEVLAEAESAGAKITKPAERTSWGGYSGSFVDRKATSGKSRPAPPSCRSLNSDPGNPHRSKPVARPETDFGEEKSHERAEREGTEQGAWPGAIAAITLFVEDLEAAKRFYREVFELPVVFEDDSSTVFRFGETLVNLLKTSEAPGLVEPATVATRDAGVRFQFTLGVDDVDAMCEELKERGVDLLNGPMNRPWGIRTASFRDPGGHIWEIAH